MKPQFISLVIPVRNEERNILALVERINRSLKKALIKFEMIFIDDHSTDQTVEILKKLQKKYPINIYSKQGQIGKAFSIIEGANYAQAEYIVMIDADLQYPPEAIPQMIDLAADNEVVIARRKISKEGLVRKIFHHGFNFFFGNILHGLNFDVQSGLKLFKKEILSYADLNKVTPWTLDLTLLTTAKDLGYKISEVEIVFSKRFKESSKVNLLKTSFEIGSNALKLKLKRKNLYVIPPQTDNSMLGAGIVHKQKRLITHTTLDHSLSAVKTFTWAQKLIILDLLLLLIIGFSTNPLFTAITLVAILSTIYFIDAVFNLYVVLKSLHFPPEITFTQGQINKLNSKNLPIYTILCPLYKEAGGLPEFLKSIEKLNWPKDKLNVILLLEEDDKETIAAASNIKLPKHVRTLIVPNSEPKTKPKACNFGLAFAKGEYVVIYDAEDQPEPNQLKKAYLGFQRGSRNLVCLQAKLNYFNPNQNLLTRFFTAEYSLWFDVVLTGLQSIQTTIPLGGTSNHFKIKALRKLQGWDPFNVAEDCDLGVRLFKQGYKTAIIDSTTLEEANSSPINWIRQRSRWIKGYLQTYLVHMRSPFAFIKSHGVHAFIFQLIIGARITFMLINPLLWLTTFAYFTYYSIVGPTIEALYPQVVFYMAVFSLVFGNFMYLYNYMIGLSKRGHWGLIKYVFLMPVYWLLASIAATIAFYQLIVKPHYWEKTIHGLHLIKDKSFKEVATPTEPSFGSRLSEKLTELIGLRKIYFGAFLLIFSAMVGNICNFAINAYLGRQLSFEGYGSLSLFTSLLSISSIPLSALSATITQKIAFLFGRYSLNAARGYLDKFLNKSMVLGLGLMLTWFVLIPFLTSFFKADSILPFIIFSPVWLIGIASANFSGYLKGTLSFGAIALIAIIEALVKLGLVIALVSFGYSELVYAAIPVSMTLALVLSSVFSKQRKGEEIEQFHAKFNLSFYLSSFVIGVTNIAFLGLDVVMVKHFLTPVEAGQYALLSLPGKMIFFFGTLLGPFMLPLVAKNEGQSKKSDTTFAFLFCMTGIFTLVASLTLSFFGGLLLPAFFGEKAYSILPYLSIYAATMVLFTVSQPIISYFQAKENHTFALVGFIATLSQIILIAYFHQNLNQVILIMFLVSAINLGLMGILYAVRNYLWTIERVFKDFRDLLFAPLSTRGKLTVPILENQKSILIFNWRDIRHKWAGGAESYLHELAKKWIEAGLHVTIFSGNDGLNPRYEIIDGIQIVRRGGFYMVYFWAVLYYLLRFRNKYDVIIDSENGIPFFTPIYISKPKFLLIHHIHQEVFREHLALPLSILAIFLETKLMPLVYKNQKIITVSKSSKDEILKLGMSNSSQIEIINPGIHTSNFNKSSKTKIPTFLYLGRLQPYKNIEVIIKAFVQVVKKYPNARLNIAGFGESMNSLKKLTQHLRLEESVSFLGRVSEENKLELLSKSWVLLQPSMVEGWGMTVIEANASYTPVIAANVNGLKDSVVDGKTGLLISAKNVDLFAKAMIDLISNEQFREYLSEQAYIWSQNFNWDKSSKQFLFMVEGALKQSSARLNIIQVVINRAISIFL